MSDETGKAMSEAIKYSYSLYAFTLPSTTNSNAARQAINGTRRVDGKPPRATLSSSPHRNCFCYAVNPSLTIRDVLLVTRSAMCLTCARPKVTAAAGYDDLDFLR